MTRYTALIDGERGAYGVVIPDCPGCVAMGDTIEEALANAADALRDWVLSEEEVGRVVPAPRPLEAVRSDPEVSDALKEGATLASVPLIRETGRPEKANMSIDSGILAAIDAEARRLGLTRSKFVEMMAKRQISEAA